MNRQRYAVQRYLRIWWGPRWRIATGVGHAGHECWRWSDTHFLFWKLTPHGFHVEMRIGHVWLTITRQQDARGESSE